MVSLRIGLIGAGRIVPAHLFGYAELRAAGVDDFRITAICSRDPDRARLLVSADPDRPRAPWRYGDAVDTQPIVVSDFQTDIQPRLFSEVQAMFDSGLVDAVDITSEVSLHHSQVVACLEAGLHALVEKPLAITMRAGRMMVQAAHRANRQLAVAEHARYIRQARLGAWVVGRGDLGTPQLLSWPSIGTRLWSPDRWVGNASWRHRRLIGAGGVSLDIGPHVFHRVRALCGEVETVSALARILEPVRYLRDAGGEILDTAEADADDAFMALTTFASGAIGQLSHSFAGHGEPLIPAGPAVFGSRGSLNGDRLTLDGQEPTTLDAHWERHGAADAARVFPRGQSDPFGLLIGDWLAAIRENRPAETSGDECLRDLAASFAIVESSLAGRPVTLGDVLDGTVDAYQRDLDAHYGLAH
ncbi:MAG: Gfo/Idh/MocA family oxidoreductase [Chloroflexi bacterium]|nr:Gfo/Idh/MocA family oxidoreductase [Chloroflexota bacterium]